MPLHDIAIRLDTTVDRLGFLLRLGRFPAPVGRDPDTGHLLWRQSDIQGLEVAR